MSFFDPPVPEPEPEPELPPRYRQRDWQGPPENALGMPAPVRVVLYRSSDLVIALFDFIAFPNESAIAESACSCGLARSPMTSCDPRMSFGSRGSRVRISPSRSKIPPFQADLGWVWAEIAGARRQEPARSSSNLPSRPLLR
jgi:hypothetical protein